MRRIVARLLMIAPAALGLGACAASAPAVSIEAAPALSAPPASPPPASPPSPTAPPPSAPAPPPAARPEASVSPQASPKRPPEDRVTVQEGTATGLVEPAQVVAALRPSLQRCFVAALKRDPSISGKLVLNVKIDSMSKVAGVKLKDELGLDVDLASCLVMATRAGTFPPTPSGATLTIPISVAAP